MKTNPLDRYTNLRWQFSKPEIPISLFGITIMSGSDPTKLGWFKRLINKIKGIVTRKRGRR